MLFFRPGLADGGADRVTLTLLEQLDRARFALSLALVRARGQLVERVPADVPIIDLRAPRLALAAPALAWAIHRHQPDVVMCTASAANVVCVVAHRLARSRARLVLSERSAVVRPGRTRRDRWEIPLKRQAYRQADLVTAVSDGVGAELVQVLGLAPGRVAVVYNPLVGPDLPARAREPVKDHWFADAESPTLLAVGRLVPDKDYSTMLRALVRVRRHVPARLVVLGLGPAREALERETEALGLTEAVRFAGFDPNPLRFMARARVLVQSSRVEGLPGTLVQAMACGTPVVATDCDHGPREVVTDGRDGFLVPVGDPDAMADRVLRLLGDPGLRSQMGAAAAQSAQRFSYAQALPRYAAALEGT
ncbi:MAG: glycosyltransferase [Kofleriaceae bacterium]|nr:glycosyltransferase [Kofleriaceae bacterium]